MKELNVDILCPSEYRDGIYDSYESRVYFSTKAESIDKAFEWANNKMPEINALDEIHGTYFYLYIEGQCVALIHKEKGIVKDEKAIAKLYLYLTDEDAYFELLEKELKEFMSFMSV